ncbi:hypothetical protein BDR26DRAFT_993546 [Obelidium mucronatum]|nr:hypothetical protein BDR26DRAFT_993546 [Obelidium mucronatum]
MSKNSAKTAAPMPAPLPEAAGANQFAAFHKNLDNHLNETTGYGEEIYNKANLSLPPLFHPLRPPGEPSLDEVYRMYERTKDLSYQRMAYVNAAIAIQVLGANPIEGPQPMLPGFVIDTEVDMINGILPNERGNKLNHRDNWVPGDPWTFGDHDCAMSDLKEWFNHEKDRFNKVHATWVRAEKHHKDLVKADKHWSTVLCNLLGSTDREAVEKNSSFAEMIYQLHQLCNANPNRQNNREVELEAELEAIKSTSWPIPCDTLTDYSRHFFEVNGETYDTRKKLRSEILRILEKNLPSDSSDLANNRDITRYNLKISDEGNTGEPSHQGLIQLLKDLYQTLKINTNAKGKKGAERKANKLDSKVSNKFQTNKGNNSSNNQDKKMWCRWCEKDNHNLAECRSTHPPDWNQKSSRIKYFEWKNGKTRDPKNGERGRPQTKSAKRIEKLEADLKALKSSGKKMKKGGKRQRSPSSDSNSSGSTRSRSRSSSPKGGRYSRESRQAKSLRSLKASVRKFNGEIPENFHNTFPRILDTGCHSSVFASADEAGGKIRGSRLGGAKDVLVDAVDGRTQIDTLDGVLETDFAGVKITLPDVMTCAAVPEPLISVKGLMRDGFNDSFDSEAVYLNQMGSKRQRIGDFKDGLYYAYPPRSHLESEKQYSAKKTAADNQNASPAAAQAMGAATDALSGEIDMRIINQIQELMICDKSGVLVSLSKELKVEKTNNQTNKQIEQVSVAPVKENVDSTAVGSRDVGTAKGMFQTENMERAPTNKVNTCRNLKRALIFQKLNKTYNNRPTDLKER